MGRKRNTRVVWKPHPGSQQRFLTCPTWESLLHGNRGGGKTDTLLMDFAQGVGKGYGADYRGLLLREATTELGDVIAKSRKWFPKMFPGCDYNASKKQWTFPDGETLWLNYAKIDSDYDQYHGHEYPWIGWEELTNHALPTVYLKLLSCNRCSNAAIPIKYRATCNPSGPGHQWVKQRFIDPVLAGQVLRETIVVTFPDEDGNDITQNITVTRSHVQSFAYENKSLMDADPTYMAKIHSLTQDNEMLRKAWIDGSWDLIMGGFFTDVWDPSIHILDPFRVSKSWNLVRSLDWGSSKPWSVGYGLETDGTQSRDYDAKINPEIPYLPKGSVIIVGEVYGWNGNINEGDGATSQEQAERVVAYDKKLKFEYGLKTRGGPADINIFEVRDGTTMASTMGKFGCRWIRAYKGSGSRVTGWALIRQMLGAAKRRDPESPHLYFFPAAQHHIRTLPLQQRNEKKPEDIDTDGEDHAMDDLRYLLTRKFSKLKRRKVNH